MIRILLLVVFIPIISVAGFSQDPAQCQQLVQARQFDAAVASCEALIKVNPSMGTLGRALAYIGKLKWDSAINDLSTLIGLDPRAAMAFAYRGGAYQQKGDYRSAVADYERALALEPRLEPQLKGQVNLARELASLSVNKKVPLEAERAALLLTLAANDLRIGRAMTALNKKPKAEIEANDKTILDKIDQSLKINPYSGGTYRLRGDIYLELDQLEAAMNDYTRAIVVDPADPTNYAARAKLQQRVGNDAYALADYSKMIEINPRDKDGYRGRAEVYEKLRQDDLALADLTKIVEIEPTSPHSYTSRFFYYFSRGKDGLAGADAAKMVALNPNDGNARYLCCQYNHRTRNYEAAIKDCTVTIDKKEFLLSELALIQRVDSYIELKKFDSALSDLAEASKSEYSAKDDIGARRGRVYLLQGRKQDAINEFNNALKLNPNNEMAQKELEKLGFAPKK
jgi:tetratricopeptide (TPR) repeat protein